LNCPPLSRCLRSVVMPPHPNQARWFSEEVDPHRGALRAYVQRKRIEHLKADRTPQASPLTFGRRVVIND
jgi:hypothetical protein